MVQWATEERVFYSALAACGWLLEQSEDDLLTITEGDKNRTKNSRCKSLEPWDIVQLLSS